MAERVRDRVDRCSLCGKRPGASGCVRCELRAAGDRGQAPPDPPEVIARRAAADAAEAVHRRQLEELVRTRGHIRVALVGCGARKRRGRHPAHALYIGSLFRAALHHARRTADEVFILSALHGVLELDQVVAHYDARLPTARDAIARWGRRVESSLRLAHVGLPLHVVVYAGAAYAAPLRAAAQSNAWRIEEPLAGLGIGQRLRWFARQRRDQGGAQLVLRGVAGP